MTGRGDGKLLRPDSNPSVTIGLSLSTSPSTLSASSEEPFNIVVTARILSSPHPERPVTLWTHLSPLHALNTRAFENIKCITDKAKHIEIWPRSWPQYRWDSEDVPHDEDFVTIPPRDQGTFSVRHQVPPDALRGAKVEQGERYRVKLTDKCLGTCWWTFGARDELDGVRLRAWRSSEAEAEEERALDADPELREELERERRDKYGERPVTSGENSGMLAMVPEAGEVEFEVV
ncbi:hypothetical protein LTR36_001828 [Oleoguttula mirabilis]|uniref:Uncharacterized protein n=1 Tax=Oleoguttula mirabilis TaxID=1507867 RepID=A0AAV9JMQ9_9PEZI|nr:hypothetical protein LTR36_001828 [Oleoguttula mirabilis]